MFPLSGGCGYCLSNHIHCDLIEGESPCLTCREFKIKCPPGLETCDAGYPEGDENRWQDSLMEDVKATGMLKSEHSGDRKLKTTEQDALDSLSDAESPPVHWMAPLDSYKTIAHELLGLPVPGLPDIPLEPTYSSGLPAFIQSLPPNLPEEDLEYLAAKGAFTVPDDSLRNELLRAFILHVHPYLPVLDLPAFLEAIANDDGKSRISLLLFHAVMFSSVAFVDSEHIHRAGYPSRKAARQEFFRKARILYDFDVERDRIVLIQSVLLMTYWHETPDDPKDFRYWLEIALSLAASVAFHNSSEWASETASHGLWKRIWWCMYTRDRLNALNLRRPSIIRDEDFSVPPPTLADFDIQRYPYSVTKMLRHCEVLRRVDQQQQLAQMFIEKSKLCTIISEIIFPISSASSVSSPAVLTRCLRSLDEWQAALPAYIQYQANTTTVAPTDPTSPNTNTTIALTTRSPLSPNLLPDGDRSLLAYRAWLKMLFLAASGVLHRQLLQSQTLQDSSNSSSPASSCSPTSPTTTSTTTTSPETSTSPSSPDTPSKELSNISTGIQSATRAIALVAEGLHQLDLVHCLPTTTVALLMPVLATHIMNIRSDSPDLWAVGFQSFYQCMKVLEKLGEVYMLAESMKGFFESVVCGDGRKGVDLDMDVDSVKGSMYSSMPTAFLEGVLTRDELKDFVHLVGQRGVVN